jgi:16S rRNA (uracil1498-N3)-methyltransferase
MPRIILPDIAPELEEINLTSPEHIRYIRNVLRLNEGAEIDVLDGKGGIFKGRIISLKRHSIRIRVLKRKQQEESGIWLVLIQPLLKGNKMDLVLQKCTELGISEIYPVVTERTIPRITRKLPHWKKVIEEATKQSGRTVVPQIHEVVGISHVLKRFSDMDCIKIAFYEKATGLLRSIGYNKVPDRIIYLTGPEGGFAENEIAEAEASGFKIVSLGSNILRAETASIVSLALIKYHFGLM